jgi:hypothetical protein
MLAMLDSVKKVIAAVARHGDLTTQSLVAAVAAAEELGVAEDSGARLTSSPRDRGGSDAVPEPAIGERAGHYSVRDVLRVSQHLMRPELDSGSRHRI